MIGQIVGSRYKILRKLGAGGMAIVYLALDEDTGKELALKVMSPQVAASPESVKRFAREFEVCSRLKHENIIALFDNGQLEDGNHFYTMDYLPHPSLDDILEKEKQLTPQRTKKMMTQVASAMCCYHKEGIVHRDLKPANIVVAKDDRFIVVDFGLVTDENLTALTRTGTVLGTPYFMSPEMVIGERVTPQADIYALGVIAYRTLTGRLPFNGKDFSELYTAIIAADYKLPSALVKGLDEGWDELLAKCLAKELGDRFADSEQLLEAISGLGKKKTVITKPVKRNSKALSGLSTTGVQKPVFADSIVSGKLAPKKIGLALAILFSLLLGWPFWRNKSRVGPFLAQGVKSHSTPSSILVTWQSKTPYLSQVKLEEGPSHRVFISSKQSETTSHLVTLSPLPPRQSYRFRILFPDGTTSLPHNAQTKALTVSTLQSHRENDELVLSFQLAFGKEVTCQTIATNGLEAKVSVKRQGRYWQVKLKEPQELVSLKANVLLQSNKELILDLKKELARLCSSPINMLNRIDGRKFSLKVDQLAKLEVSKIYEKLKAEGGSVDIDDVARIRRKATGAVLIKKLKEVGAIAAYDQLIPLSALAMNTRLLPFAQQCRLYEGAMTMYEISMYSKSFKLEPSYEMSQLLDLGMFAQRFGRQAKYSKKIVLWKSTAENAHLRFGPPEVHFYKRPLTHKTFPFKILRKEALKKANLYVYTHSFSSMVIKATVNERFAFFITDMDLYGGTAGKRHIMQPIPRELLRAGKNTITLSFERHLTAMKRVNDLKLNHMELLLDGP